MGVSKQLQKELIGVIRTNAEIDDVKEILYTHLFTHELDLPVLHFEKDGDSFILDVLPDDLTLNHLRVIDDVFDKFEILFMPSKDTLIRLKFVLKGD